MRRVILGLLALLCVCGTGVRARADTTHVTAECRFTCSTKGASFDRVLQEGNDTYVKLDAGGWFALEWTLPVATVWWQWNILPQRYTVQELDAGGATLRELSVEDAQIVCTWHIGAGVSGIRVQVEAPSSMCALRAYTAEQTADARYLFEPVAEKTELMVFSTHPDDEFVMFGGLLPLYAGEQGRTTTVVYMANNLIRREREALHGLWHAGVKTYPIFLEYPDELPVTKEAQLAHFGGLDAVTRDVVGLLRRYRPEVVVTHDIDGEYRHGAHMATSEAVRLAVDAAADPAQYPESAALYGVWQVKKLYLHLYPENTVLLDDTAPLAAFAGKSAMDVASECYVFHHSQKAGWGDVMRSRQYDGAKYGLYATTVGPDTAGVNDLFEHIDAAVAAEEAERNKTPAPTETPAPAETPVPTETPASAETPVPTETSASAETPVPAEGTAAGGDARTEPSPDAADAKGASVPALLWVLGGGIVVAASALCVVWALQKRKNRRRRRRRK